MIDEEQLPLIVADVFAETQGPVNDLVVANDLGSDSDYIAVFVPGGPGPW